MKLIEKFFFFMFPLALLKGTPWEDLWREQEKKEFFTIAKVFFAITMIGYAIHYFTVDRAEGLAPSDLWFNYRFGMAGLSLACLLFYSSKLSSKLVGGYRIPAILAGAVFCYLQTRTVIWYPKVPYLYSFAFVLVCTVILRTSISKSLVVSIVYLSIIVPTLQEAGVSAAMISSGSFFTLAVVVFARSKYVSDLKYFIATQNNIQQQKKFIEVNLEFTNQIKAFLPSEISIRLDDLIQEKRMSVIQSIDDVLRPKRQFVACLFSDIRGFTQGSNDLDGFVTKAMFPNVKASTIAIEKQHGIPRKIGDLIFAYYDLTDPYQCIEAAMKSAIDLSRINSEMNESLPDGLKIRRYILISAGEAIVGNLSGYESSIEITAIGSPVNYLSRVDEATKNPSLKNLLFDADIIISPQMVPYIRAKFPTLSLIEIALPPIGIKIRDFEDVKSLFVFRLFDTFSDKAPVKTKNGEAA